MRNKSLHQKLKNDNGSQKRRGGKEELVVFSIRTANYPQVSADWMSSNFVIFTTK